MCFLVTLEVTVIKFFQHNCLNTNELNKSNTNRHANVDRDRHFNMDREEHTKWLSSSKWSSLKTQTGSIMQNEQVIFRNTYIHNTQQTHLHPIATKEAFDI